jgi:hypothetical protein
MELVYFLPSWVEKFFNFCITVGYYEWCKVSERVWPRLASTLAADEVSNYGGKMFEANENGFFMGFSNGYMVSVKWDSPRRGGFHCEMNTDTECAAAEVAVFQPDGKFVALTDEDDVLRRQTADEVAAIITKYSSL